MLNKELLMAMGGSQIPVTHIGLVGDGDDRWGIMPYLLGYRNSHFEPETLDMGDSSFYYKYVYNFKSVSGEIFLHSDPGGFVSGGMIYLIRCDNQKGVALEPNPLSSGIKLTDWLFPETDTGKEIPLYMQHLDSPPLRIRKSSGRFLKVCCNSSLKRRAV